MWNEIKDSLILLHLSSLQLYISQMGLLSQTPALHRLSPEDCHEFKASLELQNEFQASLRYRLGLCINKTKQPNCFLCLRWEKANPIFHSIYSPQSFKWRNWHCWCVWELKLIVAFFFSAALIYTIWVYEIVNIWLTWQLNVLQTCNPWYQ